MGHLDVSTLKGLSNIDETHNLCLNSKSFSDFKTEILNQDKVTAMRMRRKKTRNA